ncbi:Legumain [Aphelenchoides fujianensis]|nr:Legumain [Aphelenchoides fujianensis]
MERRLVIFITLMYDDIANNSQNPFPGQIFNAPKGKDVYGGVKVEKLIDYRGEDVSPSNFLAILQGTEGQATLLTTALRKFTAGVVGTLTDYCSAGSIAFPSSVLTVKQLNTALKDMHKNERYSQLTFYLEACESGSMFEKGVARKHRRLRHDGRQFARVLLGLLLRDVGQAERLLRRPDVHSYEKWPSRDIPLKSLEARLKFTNSVEKQQVLAAQIAEIRLKREYLHDHMTQFVRKLIHDPNIQKSMMEKTPGAITNLDCHHDIVHAFDRACLRFGSNPYATNYVKVLANLLPTERILRELMDHCLDLKHTNIL